MLSLLVTSTMSLELELEQSSAMAASSVEEEGPALLLGSCWGRFLLRSTSWRPGGIVFFREPDDVVMDREEGARLKTRDSLCFFGWECGRQNELMGSFLEIIYLRISLQTIFGGGLFFKVPRHS